MLHVVYAEDVPFLIDPNRTSAPFHFILFLILTLNKHADDQEGPWLSRGAGQYTDVILQTVRDPTSLSAQH